LQPQQKATFEYKLNEQKKTRIGSEFLSEKSNDLNVSIRFQEKLNPCFFSLSVHTDRGYFTTNNEQKTEWKWTKCSRSYNKLSWNSICMANRTVRMKIKAGLGRHFYPKCSGGEWETDGMFDQCCRQRGKAFRWFHKGVYLLLLPKGLFTSQKKGELIPRYSIYNPQPSGLYRMLQQW